MDSEAGGGIKLPYPWRQEDDAEDENEGYMLFLLFGILHCQFFLYVLK